MNADDPRPDAAFIPLNGPGTPDVSPARADRLRQRCHAALREQRSRPTPAVQARGINRWLVPALGGTWSMIYALETLRRALAFYRP